MSSHTHVKEDGTLVKCYHQCKNLLSMPSFWIGATLSYPIEHFIWEQVFPFAYIGAWLGMH